MKYLGEILTKIAIVINIHELGEGKGFGAGKLTHFLISTSRGSGSGGSFGGYGSFWMSDFGIAFGIILGIIGMFLVTFFILLLFNKSLRLRFFQKICCTIKEENSSATSVDDASRIKEEVAPDESSLPERDRANPVESQKYESH